MATAKARSFSEAAQAAGVPQRASTGDIAEMGCVTFITAEAAEARNPQTGQMGPGFLTTVEDSDGRRFQAFIGGVVLQRDLAKIIEADAFPFTAHLERDGEGPGAVWRFADCA